MVLPFNITYENPGPALVNLVEATFRELERLSGSQIPRRHYPGEWAQGDYGSLRWYVQRALDPQRGQVSASALWRLFETEPWQEHPHYEFAVLDTDLFADGTNFVFGETRQKILADGLQIPDMTASGKPYVTGLIQSTHRIRGYGERSWRPAFAQLMLHELGHFYGLPTAKSPNFIRQNDPRSRGRLDINHCDDRNCVMEQVNIDGRLDLGHKAVHMLHANRNWFCAPDLTALQDSVRRLYQ